MGVVGCYTQSHLKNDLRCVQGAAGKNMSPFHHYRSLPHGLPVFIEPEWYYLCANEKGPAKLPGRGNPV